MSFGNPLELFLLAGICFLRLMLFSVSACLIFVASTERKIGLLLSMAVHISVTTCDASAADHVVRFTRPSPSVFAYCKRSKTGAGEGLGTRLHHTINHVNVYYAFPSHYCLITCSNSRYQALFLPAHQKPGVRGYTYITILPILAI